MSTVPGTSQLVRGLQARVARALPAEHVEYAGDWLLRHTTTSSWWMGTVLPHGDARRYELALMIRAVESFYAGFGVPAVYQISPGACPAGLDDALAARNYRRHRPSMSLRSASTAQVQSLAESQVHPRGQVGPSGRPAVQLDETPGPTWFEAWYAVHGHSSDPDAEWARLGRVNEPSAYASALHGDEVVAVGRAVADAGWAGVFGMATVPEARGRGAARSVLAALADWAAGQGADDMYLQVESDNEPALRLYSSAGFTEVCRYHYRVQSPLSAASSPGPPDPVSS